LNTIDTINLGTVIFGIMIFGIVLELFFESRSQ